MLPKVTDAEKLTFKLAWFTPMFAPASSWIVHVVVSGSPARRLRELRVEPAVPVHAIVMVITVNPRLKDATSLTFPVTLPDAS